MIESLQTTIPATATRPHSAAVLPFEAPAQPTGENGELKEAFQEYVGETFFQLMLKSLRTMHDKPAYFHGGQAEEIFQSQLDQHLVSDLANSAGLQFSEDLYDLFRLQLRDANSAQAENQNEPHSPGTATETLL